MKVEYTITNYILTNLFEFAELHGALYSTKIPAIFRNKVSREVSGLASLAAVAIDTELDIDTITSRQGRIKGKLKKEKDWYLKVRQNIGKLPPFNTNLDHSFLEKLHQMLYDSDFDGNFNFRNQDKLIGKIISQNGVYKRLKAKVKTKPEEIEKELIDLTEWINSEYRLINPVVLSGISHVNLLRIHPYNEGNGRLARIYERRILQMQGLDSSNLIPTEYFYFKERERYYYELSKAIDSGICTSWLEFFSEGLVYSINYVIEKIFEISGGTIDILNRNTIKTNDKEMQIILILNEMGQESGAEIARRLGVTRQNINTVINNLINKNVVQKIGRGTSIRYTLSKI